MYLAERKGVVTFRVISQTLTGPFWTAWGAFWRHAMRVPPPARLPKLTAHCVPKVSVGRYCVGVGCRWSCVPSSTVALCSRYSTTLLHSRVPSWVCILWLTAGAPHHRHRVQPLSLSLSSSSSLSLSSGSPYLQYLSSDPATKARTTVETKVSGRRGVQLCYVRIVPSVNHRNACTSIR